VSPELSPVAISGWIARGRAIASKTNHFEAERWLLENHAPDQVRRIFKADAIWSSRRRRWAH